MDTLSQNFIAHLYNRRSISTSRVDECVDYWRVQVNRGRRVSFPEIAVERGLVDRKTAKEIIDVLRRESASKEAPKSRKPVAQDSVGEPVEGSWNLLVTIAMAVVAIVLLFFVTQKIVAYNTVEKKLEVNLEGPLIEGPTVEQREQEAAEALLKAREYKKAKEKFQALLKSDRLDGVRRREVESALLRIKSTEELMSEVKQLKRDLRLLIKNEQFDKAKRLIRDFFRAHPEVRSMSEGRELKETLLLLSRTAPKAALKPKSAVRKDPRSSVLKSPSRQKTYRDMPISKVALTSAQAIEPERLKYFKQEAWELRYQRAKNWVVKEKNRRLELLKQEASQVCRLSKKKPLTVRLTQSYEIRDAVVERYDEKGFSLRSRRGVFGYRWDLAARELALSVRSLGVDEKSADSLFRYAKFCLKQKYYKRARRGFEKAAALDSRFRSRIPQLDLVEKVAQAFHGDMSRLGGELVRFHYPFQKSDEQLDWSITRFAPLFRRGQLIIPNGPKKSFHFVGLGEVEFHDFARVTLRLGKSKGAIAALVLFSGSFGIQATYYRDAGAIDVYDIGAGRSFSKPIKVKRGAKRLRMTYRGRRLSIQLDTKQVAAFNLKGLEKFKIQFGGRGQGGRIELDDFRVEGRVSKLWLKKTFQEADDIVAAVLADDGVGAPASAWLRKPEPLSADQPSARGAIASKVDRALRIARREIGADSGSLDRAYKILSRLVSIAPSNAAVYYERARLLHFANLSRLALFDLNAAVELKGGFYEALALRARVLTKFERYDDARRDIKQALLFRRDSAGALLAAALLEFAQRRIEKAQKILEVAYALWPRDLIISTTLRNFTHVINGPPWERRHKVETEHYVVLSDISMSRARFYAERLEWIHSFYQQQFPYSVGRKKSLALIFNTEEGYHQYANLTSNSRVESTLGYFHPGFNQLLLFEDAEGSIDETLDTLYHEGFHQFISKVCKELPLWANEGLAEYYGPTRFNQYGEVKSVGAINPLRLPFLKEYKRLGRPFLKFSDLMNQSQRQFQSGNVGLKYAQSWAMIHFFKHGKGSRRDLFKRYFSLLRSGQSSDYAFQETYKKLNLNDLERKWQRYVQQLVRKSK
jgi:tetratricopeptide (TPR) repeat protein